MIRKAIKKDAKVIAKIKIDGWRSAYKGIVSQYYLSNMNIEKEAEKIENVIAKEDEEHKWDYYVYIADNVDKIFAFSAVSENKCKEYSTDCEIIALYVNPNYHRMGIGTNFLDHMKQDFAEKNLKNILIWCLEDNSNAKSFYEKNGGILVGEKDSTIGTQTLKQVGYRFSI